LREDGIDVLNSMRFVDDDILEAEFLERRFLDEADLITCYADFEVLRDESVRDDFCALVFCTSEEDNVKVRSPLFELARPILESCFWDDN
jgi:predicted enzyme involved in methoxymalonyl-ACP biosynthesis